MSIPPVTITNRLDAAHLAEGSPLYAMIVARAKQRGLKPAKRSETTTAYYWGADWWGLDQWAPFSALEPDRTKAILVELSRALLNETYFIEKSGSAYAAKMILLAKDTDTAQLYAHIAADEATHLTWVEPFVAPEDKVRPEGAFLGFLTSLIETASPQVLLLLVQIILEGWGLDHYRRLADGCLSPELVAVLQAILKDEALHHHSGVVQFDAGALMVEEQAFVREAFRLYASMVAAGPVTAHGIVSAAAGPMNEAQSRDLWRCLGHPVDSQRKLDLLRGLMRQKGMEAMVDDLSRAGCFDPSDF